MIFQGQNSEYLELKELPQSATLSFATKLTYPLVFIWVTGSDAKITHDGITLSIPNHSILCLSAFHQVELQQMEQARFIQFNREFYCVLEHDQEVSCKGLLFFNASQLPVFSIPTEEIEKFEILWRMFTIEMQSKDELQLEMLQMMLKRFIILCTRIYKLQTAVHKLDEKEVDLIRSYQFLVEQHFRTKHSVQEYADLLHKSPKTLSNLFTKLSGKSPLQLIHERKLLEAKRWLLYTDKSVKEVAYDLGFEDIQTFSRFFKKLALVSPSEFKQAGLGSLANSSGNPV
jgi:AraC-like DNA-binding protein